MLNVDLPPRSLVGVEFRVSSLALRQVRSVVDVASAVGCCRRRRNAHKADSRAEPVAFLDSVHQRSGEGGDLVALIVSG